MALMERVATLLRANVNDLIDRAEDPEKMMKQLLVDMENQLLQVKTQVAGAIANQHLLEQKRAEQAALESDWKQKASLAIGKGNDAMARAALERSLSHEAMAQGFARQGEEQKVDAEALRATYNKLQGKLKETETQCELLRAQHRRSRMTSKASEAHTATVASVTSRTSPMARLKAKLQIMEADNHAGKMMLETDSIEDSFATMERDDKIERLLEKMKEKDSRMLEAG